MLEVLLSQSGDSLHAFACTLFFYISYAAVRSRTTGSWITDGWVVGLLATIVGSKVARNDGTHMIHSLTATVLTFAPGVVFTTTTVNTNVTTSTLGNDGPKDIVAVTATTLTLARHNGFRQTGALSGSGITVTASKYPRPLIVRAP